jgi:ADP-ribose pyrophosphatase YjhB (NUDIX family)
MSRRFCERCGAAVGVEDVDGRPRQVCSECGTVFYQNPLPVAACVVLNDRREVLLVRRRYEPHRGEWCLPTGFAEVGETIEEAALRELREETGLEGSVYRLLTARSLTSDFYGDLLFVCFEVEATGGSERAGDDAEEIAFFGLADMPPLAFESHTEAVAMCESLYREPWAIQDSFVQLYSDEPEGMLSDALVALIEERAEEICRRWLTVIAGHPTTAGYARMDLADVRAAALEAMSHFCEWLQRPGESEAAVFYREIGRLRSVQGIRLDELLSALTLLRKEIWTFAREHQVLASPLDVYRVMELSRRVVLFFDKALHAAAAGYAEADSA